VVTIRALAIEGAKRGVISGLGTATLFVLGLTIVSTLVYGPTILALYLLVGGLLIGIILALTLGLLTGALIGAIMGALFPRLSPARAVGLGVSLCGSIVIIVSGLLIASGNTNGGPGVIVACLAYLSVGGFVSRHLYLDHAVASRQSWWPHNDDTIDKRPRGAFKRSLLNAVIQSHPPNSALKPTSRIGAILASWCNKPSVRSTITFGWLA
jgi:hypothetical protein